MLIIQDIHNKILNKFYNFHEIGGYLHQKYFIINENISGYDKILNKPFVIK